MIGGTIFLSINRRDGSSSFVRRSTQAVHATVIDLIAITTVLDIVD